MQQRLQNLQLHPAFNLQIKMAISPFMRHSGNIG
jgi:hypothetical protein